MILGRLLLLHANAMRGYRLPAAFDCEVANWHGSLHKLPAAVQYGIMPDMINVADVQHI